MATTHRGNSSQGGIVEPQAAGADTLVTQRLYSSFPALEGIKQSHNPDHDMHTKYNYDPLQSRGPDPELKITAGTLAVFRAKLHHFSNGWPSGPTQS